MTPILLLLLLAGACENDDTVLTGLSGVLIFGLVAVFVVHWARGRK